MENVKEKKQNNTLFNVKLYLDGLRQLKLIGIMGAVIMAFAAVLVPMGINIENSTYREYYNGRYSNIIGRVFSYDILEMNPIIVLTFFVIVPLMTVYLFSFLNKRNACDFYHAIPDTRERLFVSYGAAILTWNVCLILGSVLISVIMAGILPWVELDAAKMFLVIVNLITACIFMYGLFMIAMSLTGTSFTNLTVAVMLLVVPRLISTVFVAIVTDPIAVLPFQYGNGILDDRLNVVTDFVTGFMFRGEISGVYRWSSFLYTLFVGIVYCLAGLYLFKKRKSETATCAAINDKLQCVLRLVPAMVICLLPIWGIFDMGINDVSVDGQSIYQLVVFYVLALLAYFVYELMTTKKLRNAIKAIPGLIWLVAYNVIFVTALFISYSVMLNDVPDLEDVKHVNIQFGDYYSYYVDTKTDYYMNRVGEVDIHSAEIKELLLSELERNVEALKAEGSLHNYGVEQKITDKNDYQYARISVTFDCGIFDKNRVIFMSAPAMEEFMSLLAGNEQIHELCFEQVPLDEISTMDLQASGVYMDSEFPIEKIYEIYEIYMEEVKELTFEDAFSRVIEGGPSSQYEHAYGFLRVHLKSGEMFNLWLTERFDDTAMDMFLMLNTHNANKMPIDDFLAEWDVAEQINSGTYASDKEEYGNAEISFRLYEGDEEKNYNCSLNYGYYWSTQENEGSVSLDFTNKAIGFVKDIQDNMVECNAENLKDNPIILAVSYEGANNINGEMNEQYYVKYYVANEEIIDAVKTIGGYYND